MTHEKPQSFRVANHAANLGNIFSSLHLLAVSLLRTRIRHGAWDIAQLAGFYMSDEAELLSILNAHGQNFLSSFSPHSLHSSKKRKRAANSDVSGISNKTRRVSEEEVDDSGSDELGDENEDEWHGFGSNGNASSAEIDEDTEDDDEGPVEHIEGVSHTHCLEP